MLHKFFIRCKFTQSKADACVYVQKFNSGGVIFVLIWVDDIILAASNMTLMNTIKSLLPENFRIKDMGKISWFVGIMFTQEKGCITLGCHV